MGVESTVGQGSAFWFELPASTASGSKTDIELTSLVSPPVSDNRVSRTVLYVEDNPANLKLVERLLARRPDLVLVTAVNGPLGVELAPGESKAISVKLDPRLLANWNGKSWTVKGGIYRFALGTSAVDLGTPVNASVAGATLKP